MNALSNHSWGVSRAVDRVWSHVVGLRAADIEKRLLMVMQTYIDDSYRPDGVYVLAGNIASAEAWANFTKDWEELLPFAPLDADGKRNFKMHRMVTTPERLEKLAAFDRVLQTHVLCSLSFHFRIADLQAAKRRIKLRNGGPIDWGEFDLNFVFAFTCLMGMFHENIDRIDSLIGNETVDFIFDKQSEAKHIYAGWEQYLEYRPDSLKPRFGSTPRFEDDQEFLPLQSADFMAWYVRYCVENDIRPGEKSVFGWKLYRPTPYFYMSMNENDIVKYLADAVVRQSGLEVIVSASGA